MDHNDSSVGRHESHAGTKMLAGLALLLSLLALGLAWMAYNRTGADLDKRIQNQVQQTTNSAQDAAGNAVDGAQDAAQDAGNAIDAGPDGVDEDDTDTGTGTGTGGGSRGTTAP